MTFGICEMCGGLLMPDNGSGGLRCIRCQTPTPDSNSDITMLYPRQKLLTLGFNYFLSHNMVKAQACFNKMTEQQPFDWMALFYLAWIKYMQAFETRASYSGATDMLLRAKKHAPGADALHIFAENAGNQYLDMLTGLYERQNQPDSVNDITAPHGIHILCFFEFMHKVTEALSWQPGESFVKHIDCWIDALIMKLLLQAEIINKRLGSPVEHLNKQDISDTNSLFAWLDALGDVIILVNERCGMRFFELQIAVRLEIAQQCMPRVADACKPYVFHDPSQKDMAVAHAGVAQAYAFVILTICHSVAEYDKILRRQFVESVSLLYNLKVIQQSTGSLPQNGGIPPEDSQVIYKVPHAQLERFQKQAKELDKKAKAEEKPV